MTSGHVFTNLVAHVTRKHPEQYQTIVAEMHVKQIGLTQVSVMLLFFQQDFVCALIA